MTRVMAWRICSNSEDVCVQVRDTTVGLISVIVIASIWGEFFRNIYGSRAKSWWCFCFVMVSSNEINFD